MSMLTDWLDWALHPLEHAGHHHDDKDEDHEPSEVVEARPKYDLLIDCFRSEQMTAAQLHAHMDDDPSFRRYVEQKLAMRRHGAGSRQRELELALH